MTFANIMDFNIIDFDIIDFRKLLTELPSPRFFPGLGWMLRRDLWVDELRCFFFLPSSLELSDTKVYEP